MRGGMQDFNYFYSNCIELTFELSCCKYPEVKALKTEWKLNLNSMITFLEMAQMGIKGLVIDRKTKIPIKGKIDSKNLKYILVSGQSSYELFRADHKKEIV